MCYSLKIDRNYYNKYSSKIKLSNNRGIGLSCLIVLVHITFIWVITFIFYFKYFYLHILPIPIDHLGLTDGESRGTVVEFHYLITCLSRVQTSDAHSITHQVGSFCSCIGTIECLFAILNLVGLFWTIRMIETSSEFTTVLPLCQLTYSFGYVPFSKSLRSVHYFP